MATPTKPPTDRPRFGRGLRVAAVVGAIAAAGLAAAQATSTVLERRAPQLAVTLSPWAAPAHERLAVAALEVDRTADGRLDFRSETAAAHARAAVERDVTSVTAWGVLALLEDDPQARLPLLDAAHDLSRRSRLVQFGLIDHHAARAELPGALAAFNELAIIAPDTVAPALPQFVAELRDPGNVAAFAEVLANDPPWTDDLLAAAAADPAALEGAYRLRMAIAGRAEVDRNVDLALIDRLVANGDASAAYAVYRMRAPAAQVAGGRGVLDWSTTVPPFDWALHDEPGLYARLPAGEDGLVFRLRPGYRGELARRLVAVGDARALRVAYEVDALGMHDAVTVSVACPAVEGSARTAQLDQAIEQVDLDLAGLGCEIAELSLSAAADSGGRGFGGTVRAVTLR